jgi:hypothetical protein
MSEVRYGVVFAKEQEAGGGAEEPVKGIRKVAT